MAAVTEDTVKKALEKVKDPELGFDIVSLGLVYGVSVDNDRVKIDMTLTSPACAAGPFLVEKVKEAVQALEGVSQVDVNLVFEPRWTEAMMSPELKKMREWGIYG